MMMQMLAAGGLSAFTDGERPADTHNEKGYYEDSRAGGIHHDASWLPEARGKAVKIVAQLLSSLPSGRGHTYGVIFMLRDLNEVLASQKDLLAARGKHGARMPDTVLQHTFTVQLQQTRKILAIRKIPALYVRYQDCLENPVVEAARINAFLGGSLDEVAMAAAVDPGLYRHRRV